MEYKFLDILSFNLEELTEHIRSFGMPKYRASQIFEWLHKKNVKSFSDMKNLPNDLCKLLEESYVINSVEIKKKLVSKIDGTEKFLYKLHDGSLIETVVMEYSFGRSVCISSQAGCKMGCVFCASGESGFLRNLSAAEMLAQVYGTNNLDPKRVVLMGCGEPLDNFENVLRFIEIVSHKQGKNIGQRNITLSTCGIVPRIYELAKLNLQINLAVSLHAPTNMLRQQLMPIANAYPLDELVTSCKHYADFTKRRVTYEYSMIDGVNDDESCAEKLAKLLKGSLCHINLIPINKTSSSLNSSKSNKIINFSETLNSFGIQTTIRRSIGKDISAACGQLRSKEAVKRK